MTKRKPPDVRFEDWLDAQIREAEERGLFESLPGKGKPQAKLGQAEDPLWWAKDLLERERVSILPPALEVRVRARKLRDGLAEIPSERALREAALALNAEIARVNRLASEGPPTAQAPLDVEELVSRWRALRGAGG
jgi:hypothetical protein